MSTDGFKQHCREIARRFLLTAVVVDDELSVTGDPPAHGDLTPPGRGAPTRRESTTTTTQAPPPRPLPVDPITWSFARQGMVCGVVSPHEEQADHEVLAKAVARADIVILDWRLNRTSRANALPLLTRILTEDQPHRLRLIAFYTGERNHERIRDRIVECLNGIVGPDQAVVGGDGSGNAIDFRACRIVVYGKPDSGAIEPSAVVREEALADQLIADFADMVEGLLPSLVLTALGAVRDNVYQVLDHFGRDLDPAFLAHRACLKQPPESQQHLVEQIASELHGIMDDEISRENPAGIEAIKRWITARFQDESIVFGLDNKSKRMSFDEILAMLEYGVERKRGPLKKNGADYDILSRGFSGGADASCNLDRRLASAMSFRQTIVDTGRQLSIGTVVRRMGDETAPLLCVTPRCDSVRLTGTSSFLFLPLSDPESKTPQLVVPTGDDQHRRMTIIMKPSEWCIEEFEPHPDRQCVLAHGNGTDQPLTFKDVHGVEYHWVGELKGEFAQSIRASGRGENVPDTSQQIGMAPAIRTREEASKPTAPPQRFSPLIPHPPFDPHLAGTPRSAQPPPPDPSFRIPRSPSPASRARAGLPHCDGPEPHCPRTCPPRTARGSSGWRHTCSRDAGARNTRGP